MIRSTFAFFSALLACAHAAEIRLPTANDALFTNQPEKFYMYVNRTFEGQTSKAWEGGCFGFVRTPMRINGEVIATKFHEGIDIAPMERDKAGNPLDVIHSIAEGKVAYISPVAGKSNYGKYVVVEHRWDASPVYSIYAHLSEITCKPGDSVEAGAVLGKMGFTGDGIDRTRSHVHLEITTMMSGRYDDWNQSVRGGLNPHGNFNGMNFGGVDAAGFFLERRKNPELKFSEFVTSRPVHFKVTAPGKGVVPEFVRRYPWILRGDPAGAVSWEIAFTGTGQPVTITASQRQVAGPTITYLRDSTVPHRYLTRNLVNGEGGSGSLTPGGKNLVALLMDDFPVATAPVAKDAKDSAKPAAKPTPKPAAKPVKPAPKPAATPRTPTR